MQVKRGGGRTLPARRCLTKLGPAVLLVKKCVSDLKPQVDNLRTASLKQKQRPAGLQKLLKKTRFFKLLPYICSR